ncbi:aminotransferase class I/II-fold pyridoxal phosphate-dependent enzyme [Streptomyces sp. B1866]|uniref:aminotransferase class I/II-fold pyridoxal phosphate-dependent enzyme n=1 Tax=Streptomyces sp. B1866 TaxID=3075431 RepID=UPI00288E5E20|nr:aminotransferase class I/II-fold pyridoxal phosphate-dependent enzyme [Streptomyces sp. B1866]MDT3400090.1 aminotransferase class I/II-fold pyridoxal phosphate-dependent enzyme [Streptomyces sp. B1866]
MNTPTLLADLYAAHDWLAVRGLLPPERRSDTLPTPHVRLHGGRTVVSFCSNNYLGLNHRPEVRAAAAQALREHTHATSESRRLGGNLALLEQLEYELAEFKKQRSALITATGLLANIAAVHGILDAGGLARRWYGSPPPVRPVVIYDELCHRSIQMGARQSSAERFRFRHNDAEHLAEILAAHQGCAVLVVTEGVFSMDGDLADLPRLVEACDTYGAVLMVDDAHGTGVYGADGSGTPDHFGLTGRIPLQVATLSKAFGGMGGAVLGDERTVTMLRTFSSGYRFTSSLPAEQAAATIAALRILRSEPGIRDALWANVRRLRAGLARMGLQPPGDGPIIPLHMGTPQAAAKFEEFMLDKGYWCVAVTPPAVSPETCRIRLTVSAMHDKEHIDGLLGRIEEIRPGLLYSQE